MQLGQWLNWDDIRKLELKWSDRWQLSAGHLKALTQTVYDVHPSPAGGVMTQ